MMLKGYLVGFSSGMFYISETGEKESFVTMPRKMFKGALEGVNFTQIDIETITEFKEPYLKEGIERMRKLGIRIGFHGESYAMGGGEKPMGMMDSAIESHYIHSHERLIQHIEGCGKLGGEFINIHPSETTPYISLGRDLQPAKLVDPWGRPFNKFLEENPKILNWATKSSIINDLIRAEYRVPRVEEIYRDLILREGKKEISPEEDKKLREEAQKMYDDELKRVLLAFVSSSGLSYGPEMVAYFIVAKWMEENNDPLWRDIVGKKILDSKLEEKNKDWFPAVSSKYIWGHFNPKETSKYPDPKPLLKKYKIYFAFEAQFGSAGLEGLYRLMRPRDMAFLCKSIGSDWVKVCFDFEHVLSQNIDPQKEIESFPYGLAKEVILCHLGWPTPHAPAHVPIPVGSEAHYYLYERLFELKKKGMKDAYLIYERGSFERGTTILALRLIKHFLDKDVLPKDLPMQFFGMDDKGPDVKRQEVTIRDHYLDPLKGMLIFPEEEYTFLSKTAAEKGKAEVWKKEQFR